MFKQYCMQDVEAERAITNKTHPLPEIEKKYYVLDQKINDTGILIEWPRSMSRR